MASAIKRKQVFVLKKFQVRYIAAILLFMFIIAFIAGYTVYMTTYLEFGEKLAAVYPQGLLLDIVQRVNTVLFVRLLIISPIVVLIGLVLSHRIAGPIVRIKKFLGRLNEGHFENELKLRDKDEMGDVADSLNLLVSRMREERYRRNELLDSLEKEAESLKGALSVGEYSEGEVAARIDAISDQLKSLRGQVS